MPQYFDDDFDDYEGVDENAEITWGVDENDDWGDENDDYDDKDEWDEDEDDERDFSKEDEVIVDSDIDPTDYRFN